MSVTVPTPVSVMVTSDKSNPIQPIDSNVTLTCTVELSPLVDVAVTVNTMWSGPAGFMIVQEAIAIISTSIYSSTVSINSFGSVHSGIYNCQARISSTIPFLTESDPLIGSAAIGNKILP